LAKKLEKWLEEEEAYRALFKLLLFLLTALMAAFAFAFASNFLADKTSRRFWPSAFRRRS
jgi:hypothetical protein